MTIKHNRDLTGTELDSLFKAARVEPAEPPPDALCDAVLREALALQRGSESAGKWGRSFREIRAALGGWPGLGGLVTASVVGFGLGLGASDMLLDVVFPLQTDLALLDTQSVFETLPEDG